MRRTLASISWVSGWAILIVAAVAATPAPQPLEDTRQAVPKSAEQSKAEHLIRTKYKAQYAKKDPEDHLALARQLQQDLAQFTDDFALRFVMLREARELAVDGGDLDESFHAIDQLEKEFKVSGREMKFSVMTEAIDKAPLSPAQLVSIYLKLSDKALATGDIDFSNKAITLCNLLAGQSRDPSLKQQVSVGALALADARREQKAIIADINKLKLHPEDQATNLTVGKYVCFVLGQWKPGVVFLSKGNDAALKALAEGELNASDATALKKAADAWWDYTSPAIGATPAKLHKHAAELYKRVVEELSGEQKNIAQQRIASAEAT